MKVWICALLCVSALAVDDLRTALNQLEEDMPGAKYSCKGQPCPSEHQQNVLTLLKLARLARDHTDVTFDDPKNALKCCVNAKIVKDCWFGDAIRASVSQEQQQNLDSTMCTTDNCKGVACPAGTNIAVLFDAAQEWPKKHCCVEGLTMVKHKKCGKTCWKIVTGERVSGKARMDRDIQLLQDVIEEIPQGFTHCEVVCDQTHHSSPKAPVEEKAPDSYKPRDHCETYWNHPYCKNTGVAKTHMSWTSCCARTLTCTEFCDMEAKVAKDGRGRVPQSPNSYCVPNSNPHDRQAACVKACKCQLAPEKKPQTVTQDVVEPKTVTPPAGPIFKSCAEWATNALCKPVSGMEMATHKTFNQCCQRLTCPKFCMRRAEDIKAKAEAEAGAGAKPLELKESHAKHQTRSCAAHKITGNECVGYCGCY